LRKFLTATLLLILSIPVSAQRQISADVTVQQVSGGQKSTTHKHVCCTVSGRLVSQYSQPEQYYSVETPNGEAQVYIPKSNMVYTDHSRTSVSKDNLLYLYLSRGFSDMGLTLYGYVLKSQEVEEGGIIKKTFTSTNKDNAPVVDVVYKDFVPIFMAHRNIDGRCRGKQYFSNYTKLGSGSFPARTTEIIYTSAKDSVVVLTTFSDLKVDSDDPLATFVVPSNAEPLIFNEATTAKKK